MKKTILILISFFLFFGIFAILPAAAEESDYYYKNVQILKIFPYKLGYYVIYRRAGLKTGEYYIPQTWLGRNDSRAVLSLTDANIDPYLTIVFNKGEFDHVRIVAAKNYKHPTWGTISPSTPIEDKFKVEKLALDF